jgi:hypothetical protein
MYSRPPDLADDVPGAGRPEAGERVEVQPCGERAGSGAGEHQGPDVISRMGHQRGDLAEVGHRERVQLGQAAERYVENVIGDMGLHSRHGGSSHAAEAFCRPVPSGFTRVSPGS